MRFPIQCRVCNLLALKPGDADGWRVLLLDRRGDLHISSNLALKSTDLPVPMQIGAYACGQTDALILTERYLERNTFEPVALADATYLASLLRDEDLRATHAELTTEGK